MLVIRFESKSSSINFSMPDNAFLGIWCDDNDEDAIDVGFGPMIWAIVGNVRRMRFQTKRMKRMEREKKLMKWNRIEMEAVLKNERNDRSPRNPLIRIHWNVFGHSSFNLLLLIFCYEQHIYRHKMINILTKPMVIVQHSIYSLSYALFYFKSENISDKVIWLNLSWTKPMVCDQHKITYQWILLKSKIYSPVTGSTIDSPDSFCCLLSWAFPVLFVNIVNNYLSAWSALYLRFLNYVYKCH